jgi:hypothetical protein
VVRAFDIIDQWMELIRNAKKVVPSNFDHYCLMEGIFKVLQEDSYMAVAKAIWFVHRNFY